MSLRETLTAIQPEALNVSSFPPGYIGGCLPRARSVNSLFPEQDRAIAIRYPRELWPEISDRNRSLGLVVRRVYGQGSLGQCSVSSSVGAWFAKAILQFGHACLPPDGLSSLLMYQELVRSPNQGIAIDTALRHFQQHGTLPLDTRANRAWLEAHGIDPRHVAPENQWGWRPPRDIDSTREHFRLDRIEDCPSVEGMVGACAENDPVVYGRQVHAIVLIWFLAQVNRSGRVSLWFDYLNSWAVWGSPLGPDKDHHIQYGRGRDTEQTVANEVGRYGAFRVHTVYESPLFFGD